MPDPVDTKPGIDKLCEKSCKTEAAELTKCAARIKAKGQGTCEPWYLDFQKCVDACVRFFCCGASCCLLPAPGACLCALARARSACRGGGPTRVARPLAFPPRRQRRVPSPPATPLARPTAQAAPKVFATIK